MARNRPADVLGGRLGQFYEWRTNGLQEPATPRIGWLRQDGGWVEVTTAGAGDTGQLLTELLEPASPKRPALEGLLGVLERETVLLTDMARIRPSTASGIQPMIDTVAYRARNMVVGIYDTATMKSPRLRQASVAFPDVLRWAGLASLDINFTHDNDGLIESGQLTLHPLPAIPAGRVRKGLVLELNTTWSVDPNDEQATVTTGLNVCCRATPAMPSRELVRTLSWVQFAIVLAHRGWITPQPGRALLDLKPGHTQPEESSFWASQLMTPPAAANAMKQSLPYFQLSDMGNAKGLARWIRFCEDNRRLVEPLLVFHRNGSASQYDHVNSMCSAIEYWAASWKSRPGW
jgi:hypothetical protein